ncbi:EAL domain-containing protein [Eubacterium sp.]|uniref:EAL domain-containing protein n=1 Tax=Eubacterium sp. TaxID=142586 RepID=UPI0025E12B44|nr:EAL domain-containing protein [Eubacterium sp.]MCR5628525.1 EAL domain-containing protein [Eubacterium sp.]
MGYNEENYFVDHFSEALEKGYIQAFYQPIYRSVTKKIMCAEALARWIEPDNGMASPALFIPALEKNNLIFDLDMEVLRQTCELYQELKSRGTLINTFSVNLSRQDFKHKDFYERVVNTLAKYGVPHDAINLEITESLMMDETKVFSDTLDEFMEAGFSIWMDDFGSGYSSLNVLKDYNFDVMKFDMFFLENFSMKGRRLLASLINMAKTLGIHTLSEGVETKEQQEFLSSVGCEALQGYYYSKPISKSSLIELIDEDISNVESFEDRQYWSKIGHLNFVSTRPLEELTEMELDDDDTRTHKLEGGIPLALAEITKNSMKFAYVSNAYLKSIKRLGYNDISEVEQEYTDHRSNQYLMMKKLIDDAINKGDIQKLEQSNKDTFFRVSVKCIAKTTDRAMIALYLTTFDSENEIQNAKRILKYSNSLFETYEVVVLFYPESNIAHRIHVSSELPEYDREASLEKSVHKFCEAQVASVDQERYLDFLDIDKVFQRVDESPKGFVQGFFRIILNGDSPKWHSVRLTNISSEGERVYLLTIQEIQGKEVECFELLSREHPELLE